MHLPVLQWRTLKRGFRFKEKYPVDFGHGLGGKEHLGLDLMCKTGTVLYAPLKGVVSQADLPDTGRMVTLKSGEVTFRNMHLDSFSTKNGPVEAGTKLGLTGNTGASSGPHLHFDAWWGDVDLGNRSKLIDPEKFFAERKVKVLILGKREPDLVSIKQDYADMGVDLDLNFKVFDPQTVVWDDTSDEENKEIDPLWWDMNIAPRSNRYDMVLFVTHQFPRKKSNGYASPKRVHGQWCAIIQDTGKPRNYEQSIWNGEDQVTGTLKHEIAHLLSYATAKDKDTTHDLDKAGKSKDLRWNIGRFISMDVPDGFVRVFRWSAHRLELKERIVTLDNRAQLAPFWKTVVPFPPVSS